MRAITAAAALLIISAGIAGCSGTAMPAHAQPPPLPGRFAAIWSDPANSNSRLFAASPASGQVVFTDAAGNLTIDSAQTGHPRHTIATSQPWQFNEIDVIGTRLYTESNENTSTGGDQIKVAVYNLATGTQIWQNVLNAGPNASVSDVLFTENGIVVQPGANLGTGAIEGLNVTDGQPTWHSTPGLCQYNTQLASSDTTAYVIQCAEKNQTTLEAIQPASGHVIWRHTFYTPAVSQTGPRGMYLADNGSVLLQLGDSSIHVYAAGGHLITTSAGAKSCPTTWCVYQAEGNQGVLELGSENAQTGPARSSSRASACPPVTCSGSATANSSSRPSLQMSP